MEEGIEKIKKPSYVTMKENEKKIQEIFSEIRNNTNELSTIYVRRKKSKITHNSSEDMYIKRKKRFRKYNKVKIFKYTKLQNTPYDDSKSYFINKRSYLNVMKIYSMPILSNSSKKNCTNKWNGFYSNYSCRYKTDFIVNIMHETQYRNTNYKSQFNPCWNIFRCQLNAKEETCCCSCNSDAMFEVMKSLYDCYKKKNCDNCNCILCGHLPREERRLGELRKSKMELGVAGKKKGKKMVKTTMSAPLEGLKIPPEKLRKMKAEGLLTPLKGKTPQQKEKILKGLSMNGIPLPTGKTASDKRIIDKVRKDVGLPPEPKTSAEKKNYEEALASGLITPLEGKSAPEKERILRGQAALGLPLPEGRTASEKNLIEKVKAEAPPATFKIPSAKLRKAKADGLLTPLQGKTPQQKEKILRGLATNGIPLPKGTTASEKKLIDKVRKDVGLPPEPKSSAEKRNYDEALASGLITPLEGKSAPEKERILRGQAALGLPLPEGRTASEKNLIAKVKAEAPPTAFKIPLAKLRKAKAEGLLTPLQGKTPEKREKILRGLAMNGIPLPKGKTASEKKLIDKVRKDVGLPPEPKTSAEKRNYDNALASGFITPLEGKSTPEKERILRGQAALGLPLPEGRTASEKNLIEKVKAEAPPTAFKIPSAKLRKAKADGLLTPLQGKTPQQKEKILKGLAMNGIPLPKGTTASEKQIIDKVRKDVGLPPEPKTSGEKRNYDKALVSGLITPLEGKSAPEKERILRGQAALGLPLPEGRTASEKKLIEKVKAEAPPTAFKIPSAKLRKAKAEGLLTPLQGKTPQQKEKILKGLAMNGIPLPKGTTASEKQIIDKVRKDVGLPPEPKTSGDKRNYDKALVSGLITPLEGKSAPEKERILRGQAALGLPLPEGRTASEKNLIEKVKAEAPPTAFKIPSAKLRKAKAEGLLTPLQGKTPQQKEKILKGLAMNGIPLPKGKTASEKQIIDKVRKDVGLPPEPKTSGEKRNYDKALVSGLITPLEGKSAPEKERILRGQAALGLPLPEGRTASEKNLIEKVKAEAPPKAFKIPSAKLRKAKAEGLLTPLQGKTPQQKEKILRGLAMNGIPLPEGKTASEKQVIDKVRKDVGLPPEPKTSAEKRNYDKALVSGLITPLEGKSAPEKERILRGQAALGLPLPEGRTASEKNLIAKVKAEAPPTALAIPSAKLRKAKAEGLLTPLEGKTPQQKEKILTGLAMNSIPLPEGKTASEKKLIDKVRKNIGLPPAPKTPTDKDKYEKATALGLVTPLEGKSRAEKEKILKGQADLGVPLPEGRTRSEKAIIKKVKADKKKRTKLDTKTLKNLKEGKGPSDECICDFLTPESEKITRGLKIPAEKLASARAAGLLTPLKGKTPAQKEKIIRGLAERGIPLPEKQTASEKKLLDKVRADLGLPPEPTAPSLKEKYARAQELGVMTPLEGKTPSQKEKILTKQAELGIPLPEGRTPSEKDLINKIRATVKPSARAVDKLRKAKEAGLLTPLEGKTPEQKEKIMRGLAKQGLPLPEAKTASEKKLLDKVRADLGLPPKPTSPSLKEKYARAQELGIMTPLEGKTPSQKEKILTKQAELGIPLPEGRTPSEKDLINKIRATVKPSARAVDKLRKAKEAGLLTPLEGKTPAQKEKIMRGLAKQGLPLPEAKTASEKKLLDKVRADLGLPPEPTSPSLKEKYARAQELGIITPLEGKTPSQKEKILTKQAKLGIPLSEGRTPSEKDLVNKIRATVKPSAQAFDKLRKAKEAGLLTPLEGKTPEEKKKNLRNIIKAGLPLPEGKSPSEKILIKKVRDDMGLPSKGIPSEVLRKAKAAGLITPLEGKTPAKKEKILRDRVAAGLPLPEGITASDKEMIKRIKSSMGYVSPKLGPPEKKSPSAKLRQAKAAGLLTPLEGKSPEQKEKILKGLAKAGIPLPEGKTKSEKKIIDKVRQELGLPPEPKNAKMKEKIEQAQLAGIITPLEGKTPAEKEKALKKMHDAGIPLPKGRTASEKALIKKVKAGKVTEPYKVSSEKFRKAKAAGLLTPLEGKTPAQKERILRGLHRSGIPLPEGKTPSEKALIKKIQAEKVLPPEKISKIDKKTAKVMKEGKGPSDECICDMLTPISFTPSVKAYKTASEKLKKAKAAGLLTPLSGKTPEQKEKILKKLAMQGIPFPDPKTPSETKLFNKVRADVGLPPEPKIPAEKEKYNDAIAAGIIVPLEGKSPAEKEKILRKQAQMGLPLPIGRTPSEKALIDNVKATTKPLSKVYIPSRKTGLITPLEGKSPEQKEKILKKMAMQGIPFPDPKTPSETKLFDKVRADIGLPLEPKSPTEKEKYKDAIAAGMIVPLEGKSPAEKEKILRKQAQMGLPLPVGRTPSEKALIDNVKATTKPLSKVYIPSRKTGLITPLEGKSPEQKEKILKKMAMQGIPFPDPKTPSETKLFDKVRADIGLPLEPKSPTEKEKYKDAIAAGMIVPLEGKSPAEKEKILRKQAQMGLPLPVGRTPSEKALIDNVKATTKPLSKVYIPSRKTGLITPLEGKSPEQKEKILKKMAMQGIPFPDPKTPSESKLFDKVRADIGIPLEPKSPTEKEKYKDAIAAGIIVPLEGKSPAEKEKILKKQAEMGLPLPEGRTPSEKALIDNIKATTKPLSKVFIPSRKAGLITPLEGKTPEQKEKILRERAQLGLPLPEGRTPSEKALIDNIRATTKPLSRVPSKKAGLITPLEGKSPQQKEQILKKMAMQGVPFPEPKNAAEKKLFDKVRADVGLPPEPKTQQEKQKYNDAIAAGTIAPLEGKSPTEKEKILRKQAQMGLPLPQGRTSSEKALIKKIKATTLPPEKVSKLDKKSAKVMKEGKGPSDECICPILAPTETRRVPSKKLVQIPSEKLRKAKEAGLLTPLKGKSPAQKEKILKGLAMQGIPLPEGQTPSEKKLIDKVRADIGLPPEPKSEAQKKLYNNAVAAGLIAPLEGKSKPEKEKILRKGAQLGLPLPEGRTPSEKSLIAKIKKTAPPPIDADILTTIEGKPPEKKEKILKSLAEAGLPLPEGKTSSEKSLITKIKAEYGIPPKPRTASEKKLIEKAKAEGLFTPLKGKTTAQKEKILKSLAKSGLPIPEGTTPSEKELVQKVKASAGILPKKVKTKSKKVGVAEARKSKGGIIEEFEDIVKTTTCDRGCGCDKKKIRFKHSYVKIRVTSPDISSLCPCPEECVPGVKGGVFTDNEGIKVTVGRVTGVPSYSSRKSDDKKSDSNYEDFSDITYNKIQMSNLVSGRSNSAKYDLVEIYNQKCECNTKSDYEIDVQADYSVESDLYTSKSVCIYDDDANNSDGYYKSRSEISLSYYEGNCKKGTSFESIYLINRDSSLSLLTLPSSISVISFSTNKSSSSSSINTSNNLIDDNTKYYKIFESIENINNINISETIRHNYIETYESFSDSIMPDKSNSNNDIKHSYVVFKINESKTCYFLDVDSSRNEVSKPGEFRKASGIKKILRQILSSRQLHKTSSLIIVMSTSSVSSSYSLGSLSSTIGIDLFEKHCNWNYTANSLQHVNPNQRGFKYTTGVKKIKRDDASKHQKTEPAASNFVIQANNELKEEKNECRIISTDTTQDRPCCCKTKEGKLLISSDIKERKVKDIVTEIVTPIILKEASSQGWSRDNLRSQSTFKQCHSNLCMPTPVRICKIPPCSGYSGCHFHSKPVRELEQKALNDIKPGNVKACDCSLEKIMELYEKRTKEMLSKACGISKEEIFKNRAKSNLKTKRLVPSESINASCNTCGSAKYPEKNIKHLCPCEQHQNCTRENDAQNQSQNNKDDNSINRCKCKEPKQSKKKITCECPEEPEPEQEIDFGEWIDEKQVKKLKSDLTQTVSGFKINIPRRRSNLDLEMTFEEALRYYANNLEDEENNINKEACACKDSKSLKSKNINCECPYEPPALPIVYKTYPEDEEEEPFRGIKFHISGKGSGSKGLNGILCFELLKTTTI